MRSFGPDDERDDWEPGDPPPDRPVHLVLEATGALGGALCARLVRQGARLVATGRDAGRLEELAKETGAEALALDARRFEEVAGAVAYTLERFGRLDGVACLDAGEALGPSEAGGGAGLDAARNALRAALPALRAHAGAIVLVGSSVSRAAIERCARDAALDHAANGVRVRCLAPDPARAAGAGFCEPEGAAARIAWLLDAGRATPDDGAPSAAT